MKITTRFIPGDWCDVYGDWLAYQHAGEIHFLKQGANQFNLALPEFSLFLRLAVDNVGNVCTVSKGLSDKLIITYNRGIVSHSIPTYSNSPAIIRPLAQGQFEIHVMTSKDTLLRCIVLNGEFIDSKPAPIPTRNLGTSQGLLGYGPDGDLRWTDDHIHIFNQKIFDKWIGYPDLANGLYVGQHHWNGCIGITKDNVAFFIDKEAGDSHKFPHVSWDGKWYYACAFTNKGVMYSIIEPPLENQDIYPDIEEPEDPEEPEKPMLPNYDGGRIRTILQNTWNYVGKPNLGSASTRESRNAFWAKFCAVMHYGHPILNPNYFNSNWGNKARSSSAQTTDDTLAWKSGNGFFVGDMITSAGADNWSFHDLKLEENLITDQAWIQPKKEDLPENTGSSSSSSSSSSSNGSDVAGFKFELKRLADEVGVLNSNLQSVKRDIAKILGELETTRIDLYQQNESIIRLTQNEFRMQNDTLREMNSKLDKSGLTQADIEGLKEWMQGQRFRVRF